MITKAVIMSEIFIELSVKLYMALTFDQHYKKNRTISNQSPL